MSYAEQRAWADEFEMHIASIARMCLVQPTLRPTSYRDDTAGRGDYLIEMGKVVIAARCRNISFRKRYPHDITIRTRSNGGRSASESDKLFRPENPVTHLLYGFGEFGALLHWVSLDATYVRGKLSVGGALNRNHAWLGPEKINDSDCGDTGFQPLRLGMMTAQERAAAVISSSPGYFDGCDVRQPSTAGCQYDIPRLGGGTFRGCLAQDLTPVAGTALVSCSRCGMVSPGNSVDGLCRAVNGVG